MEPKKDEKIVLINNNDILPNRFQPRKKFSEEELLDLTESIKKYGVLEPIIVRPLGDKYELVAGERRYKANVLAGNDTIPARIIDLDDAESSEIAIIENLQRKDLSALEEALSYKRAIDLGYATQQQLAEKVGKSQSYIANKIRLLKLSDEVQDALLENKISERHARSLLRIDSLKQQNEMLNRIINERLTVRKTDEEIDKMNNGNNNLNNGEELQTTPLSSIFNNDNQPINENSVFTFGPDTPDNNEGQNLMNFDLNGNPIEDSSDDDSSSAPQFNMFGQTQMGSAEPTVEPQMNVEPEPFNMFTQPQMGSAEPTVEPQMNVQPEPFNMFTQPQMESTQPTVEPQMNVEPEPFNMFTQPQMGSAEPTVEPQMNVEPEPFNMFGQQQMASTQPTVEPQMNVEPEPFNMFGQSQMGSTQPTMEPQMNVEPEPFNMFDQSQMENTQPFSNPVESTPSFDLNNSSMPQTPIFNSNQPDSIAEFKKPEPIIVTDYSKQYDPVMPDTQPKVPDIDLKTIINLIRQCSDTIEKCGYKIDTEEYDLENMYQVVFKIDKQ